MDFFIDSGVVIGYSDTGDEKFHDPCKEFIRKFPPKENGYHSIKYIVNEEIRSTEKKRLEQRKKNALKLFPQRAKIFCDLINDVANKSHLSFDTLFKQIHDYLIAVRTDLKRKEHDAKLLTSAFIWAYEDGTLQNPHFITTDWTDICKNKPKLYSFVTSCLPKNCLKISFVIDCVS
ncbi:MAG: hypothetical protein WB811_02085 [Methanoregula sp.]|uniref:hypothetical protein n=2 Tax=Methanoregula sp. TaxID=2052170 RepID=UPI003BAF4B28